MQSLIAVACKLLRVFHVMLTKDVDYDPDKVTCGLVVKSSEKQVA